MPRNRGGGSTVRQSSSLKLVSSLRFDQEPLLGSDTVFNQPWSIPEPKIVENFANERLIYSNFSYSKGENGEVSLWSRLTFRLVGRITITSRWERLVAMRTMFRNGKPDVSTGFPNSNSCQNQSKSSHPCFGSTEKIFRFGYKLGGLRGRQLYWEETVGIEREYGGRAGQFQFLSMRHFSRTIYLSEL